LKAGQTSDGGYPDEVVRRFPKDVDAPRGARALLEEISAGVSEGDCADLNIAVSELVTNAVVHGSGMVTVRVCRDSDAVRIEVIDDGGRPFAWPEPPAVDHDGGWGLHVVETFTDRYGIDLEHSTMVWCEKDLEPAPSG